MKDLAPKRKLLRILNECLHSGDPETAHKLADNALLEFINDPEVSALFDKIIEYYG